MKQRRNLAVEEGRGGGEVRGRREEGEGGGRREEVTLVVEEGKEAASPPWSLRVWISMSFMVVRRIVGTGGTTDHWGEVQ